MREQWSKRHRLLVEEKKFDPDSISGEVETLNGGFTSLGGLRQKLFVQDEDTNWADLVVVAQAWHWADPDYGEAIVSRSECFTEKDATE